MLLEEFQDIYDDTIPEAKDTRNKIVEVKVEELPTSAQEEPKQKSSSQVPSSTVTKPKLSIN